MNCGDWVDSCTAIVERHDGRMELVDWIREPAVSALDEMADIAAETACAA